jgi:hypothetical protein
MPETPKSKEILKNILSLNETCTTALITMLAQQIVALENSDYPSELEYLRSTIENLTQDPDEYISPAGNIKNLLLQALMLQISTLGIDQGPLIDAFFLAVLSTNFDVFFASHDEDTHNSSNDTEDSSLWLASLWFSYLGENAAISCNLL